MKLTIYLSTILLVTTLFQGCGAEDTAEEVGKQEKTVDTSPSTTVSLSNLWGDSSSWYDDLSDWISSTWNGFFSDDPEQVYLEDKLDTTLISLAETATDVDDFTLKGIKVTVEYVVNEYFSIASGYFLEDKDWGNNDNQYLYQSLYSSSETLKGYMADFYNETISANNSSSHSPSRVSTVDDRTLIQKIIDEIYNILAELFTGFFSFGDDVVDVDVNYTGRLIDPTQTENFIFTMTDLEGATYYVASEQYMTVTFENDGLSGYGDIGYGVGASFTSSVSADKLLIDMDGVYEVKMLYKDPGYCYVTQMTDKSDNSTYPAYFFLDETVYEEASNVSSAKSLCYLHSTEYKAKVIAVDSVLEPIQDIRVNHAPVAQSSTSTMVSELLSGIDNTASITDAKYFARKMRHGIFAIYTTNEQTHTLQATESEKVSRELLPLAASSAIGMEELLTGAYDSSIAFQSEVNRDLNNSFTEINGRLDELITAISVAIDATTATVDGIATTPTYGDRVVFHAKVTGTNIFKNSGTADVTMTITNLENNGRSADIIFKTVVESKIFGDGEIKFDQVSSAQANNFLSGNEYKLTVDTFSYVKKSGIMKFSGAGYLGTNVKSKFDIDKYDIVAIFPYDTLELESVTATVDGNIKTKDKRNFEGTLVFDGSNSNNSQMDGTLVGINNEPTIKGLVKTSLNTTDITDWYASTNTTEQVVNNLGDQSYSMDVKVTSKDLKKSITTNMLVQRDDDVNVDTWTYLMKDLEVIDDNIKLNAASIYLVQKGNNTLVQTMEKIALNGISADSDMNAMVNAGWNIAKDFNNIGIEGLQVTMKPSSGDVNVKSTIHVINNINTMTADMNSSYSYGTTYISASGDFATTVSVVSAEENSYVNNFTMAGDIKVTNKYSYNYSVDYTDSIQDMLFTSTDSTYQMGFRLTDSIIIGGDSYGVLATFIMNETYDILENMHLVNDDSSPLGVYNRSEDKLKINFSDNVEEYMYLY